MIYIIYCCVQSVSLMNNNLGKWFINTQKVKEVIYIWCTFWSFVKRGMFEVMKISEILTFWMTLTHPDTYKGPICWITLTQVKKRYFHMIIAIWKFSFWPTYWSICNTLQLEHHIYLPHCIAFYFICTY